jgi:hypothetical protein
MKASHAKEYYRMITKLKKNGKSFFFTVVLLTSFAGFTLAAKKGGVADGQKQVDHTFEQIKLLVDVYQQVVQNYVDEVDPQNLIYGAASGLVGTLDPFSQFMIPEAREEMPWQLRNVDSRRGQRAPESVHPPSPTAPCSGQYSGQPGLNQMEGRYGGSPPAQPGTQALPRTRRRPYAFGSAVKQTMRHLNQA